MRATTKSNIPLNERVTVDTKELMALLGCGRDSAIKAGEEAGARVIIGKKRILWNMAKIRAYIDRVDG